MAIPEIRVESGFSVHPRWQLRFWCAPSISNDRRLGNKILNVSRTFPSGLLADTRLYGRTEWWNVRPTMRHTAILDSKSRLSLARVGGRPGQRLNLPVDGRNWFIELPAQAEDDDRWTPSISLEQLFRHKVADWEPGRMPKENAQRVRL